MPRQSTTVCPHCRVAILPTLEQTTYEEANGPDRSGVAIAHGQCPSCRRVFVLLRRGRAIYRDDAFELEDMEEERVVFPLAPERIASEAVPADYRRDLNEAAAVAAVSSRASAALSRRLLQTVLRDHFQIGPADLVDEIGSFLTKTDLPPDLRLSVDAVRQVGNFAVHPVKSKSTGEIVDVEPGEADWLVQTCEWLLEYAFVQPSVAVARLTTMNAKLADLGKPPLRT